MVVCSAKGLGLRPRLASLFQFAAVFAFLFDCLAFASYFLPLSFFLRSQLCHAQSFPQVPNRLLALRISKCTRTEFAQSFGGRGVS